MEKQQEITVLGKDGKPLSKCTKKRAYQLITRQAAKWVEWNVLQLLYDRQDKKQFKREAMVRDNWTCYICGYVMYEGHPEVTADHIKSRTKGGTDFPENLACCCKDCNEAKGKMDLEDFLRLYGEEMKRRRKEKEELMRESRAVGRTGEPAKTARHSNG